MWYVSDHGPATGPAAMKAEIFARGPIDCGVDATNEFLAYKGGIFSGSSGGMIDHIIEVVGWGMDEATKTDYWILRNSWGTFWGESGWARVGPIGTNQLSIESACNWGVPSRTKVT
jgi:cathepsin X